MSTSSINPLSNTYLQSIISTALQGTQSSNQSLFGANALTSTQQPDNTRLSPFAQMLSELQQLQQSDPSQYQQVTQQIATNLQNAAQTAQSEGKTNAANELNKLANDFTSASQNGQLPNVKDLAQAVAHGHHHHHHAHAPSADADGDSGSSSSSSSSGNSSSSSSTSSTSASQLSQLFAAFQANGTQNESLNPTSIILNTLNSAGITSSNS